MIQKHKKTLIITSLLILLPAVFGLLFWNQLPDSFATHWGADGQADGWGSKAFAVFGIPAIMLIFQWFGVLVTALDHRNENQSKKAVGMVLWIMPAISIMAGIVIYGSALGVEFSMAKLPFLLVGLMLAVIGNYLPKCKLNSAIGIKLPWSLASEENWNATHRISGRLWLFGGFGIMAAAFLPMQYGIWTLLGIILVISIVPVVYSYCFYRKQLAQGTLSPAKKAEPSRAQKIATAVLIALTIIFLAVVLFTGKITCTFSDNSFTISGSGAGSLTVDYDQITSITLTEEDISGQRVFGIANHRILAGSFHSDALGDYTRYTYCNSELYILISAGDKILLLNGENPEQTQDIYKQILSHLDEPMDLGITLTAENVTPTGLTLICQQSGGSFTGELTTGSAFTLQKYENGQWIPVESNGDIFWTMEAWLIPQNDTITWDVNWEHIYGSLTPGQYRIGKIFTAFRSAGNCDEATIYAEFEIR